MLKLEDITIRLGGNLILDRVTASLPPKCRVGLVGRNGAGKSTLIKVMAGELEPDSGRFQVPNGTRIGHLSQHTEGSERTPIEMVLDSDTERKALLDSVDNASDPDEIADIHERLRIINAHEAPARAARILAGLGFDEDAQHRPLNSFSGGWRMRVALSALLFVQPDLLLLDEPSNHLDLESELWLESFLKSYPASIVIISHERELLNSVVEHILNLDGGKLTLYPGNYNAFERLRREQQAQVEGLRLKQEKKRKELQAYVDRWRYKTHTAKQAQSRMKALERMEPIASASEDPALSFDFPSPEELRPPLITLNDTDVGYVADKPVLSQLDLRIDPDDRIALVGRNGNGKTTLARLLAGHLKPLKGNIQSTGKMRIGYFAQHQAEDLLVDETPLQHMTRMMLDAKPGAVRSQLGRFGFSGDMANRKVGQLSGGERARLALALVTREAPHILLLDEPTNHLDVDAREALVQALANFGGAVIIVSHDRHLLELTAERLVLVADGRATEFTGTLVDYQDLVMAGASEKNADTKGKRPANKKEKRRLTAEKRKRNANLRKDVSLAEAEVHRLSEQSVAIDRALSNPSEVGVKLRNMAISDLMKKRADVERDLARAELEWLEASGELDKENSIEI
ncbi:MAG: ABC-F family ATP-binding cassette domain-containing protein [Rhodospirillaceae bacterium]